MVNSIGGSSAGNIYRPDPQEIFKKIDTDNSGGISQAELKAFSEDMQKKTGQTLDSGDTAFTTYDTDGSGTLSTEELNSLLESNNPGPPAGAGQGMAPPPPPPPDQATAAYSANSGQDTLSSLISSLQDLLDKLSSDGDSDDSSSTDSVGTSTSPRPDPLDFFNKVDSDGSGEISQAELKTLAEDMKNTTGGSIDTGDEAFKMYDTNGDGSLSQDELKTVMDNSRSGPPHGPGIGMRPQLSSTEQTDSSASDSLQSQISMLRDLLNRLSEIDKTNSSGSDSLLNITT
jgi:Ca2+-binding EF-hand superfamily protein